MVQLPYKLEDPQYCPFCGSDDIWLQPYVGGMGDRLPYCYCDNCKARGPEGAYDELLALDAWEKRPLIKRKLRISHA